MIAGTRPLGKKDAKNAGRTQPVEVGGQRQFGGAGRLTPRIQRAEGCRPRYRSNSEARALRGQPSASKVLRLS